MDARYQGFALKVSQTSLWAAYFFVAVSGAEPPDDA